MALIKCPECGKEISDKANSCPNCGCLMWQTDMKEYEDQKESGVSIASLVCYLLTIIFSILSLKSISILLGVASLILVIISYVEKGKCTCANIVFWINTVAIAILLIIVIISIVFY